MATFMNDNPGKIVVAPAVWFGGNLASQITDVFFNDWNYI
jgi:hypothetical protein